MSALNRNLRLLLIINVVMMSCFHSMVPLFPLFLQENGANVFEVALVVSMQSLISIAFTLLSGFLTDRIGSKKLIVLSLVNMALSILAYTFVTDWVQVIPFAILFSSSLSIFLPPRFKMLAQSTTPERLTTITGMMATAWPLGILIGPLIGGYTVENYGWNFHFYLVACLALFSLVLSLALKDNIDEESIDQKISGNDLENIPQEPVFTREILSILIIYVFYCIAIGSATTTTSRLLPIYLTEKFKVDKIQLSLFFSVGSGLATLLPQIPAGILADRYGRKKLMLYCFSTLPILSLLLPRLDGYIPLLLLFFIMNVLYGATWPSSEAYMMNLLPTRVGTGMSIRSAAMRVGGFIGPLVGGYLWQVINPSAIFSASALFYLIAIICIFLLPRAHAQESS